MRSAVLLNNGNTKESFYQHQATSLLFQNIPIYSLCISLQSLVSFYHSLFPNSQKTLCRFWKFNSAL